MDKSLKSLIHVIFVSFLILGVGMLGIVGFYNVFSKEIVEWMIIVLVIMLTGIAVLLGVSGYSFYKLIAKDSAGSWVLLPAKIGFRMFFIPLISIGGIFKIPKDHLRKAFIEINNILVLKGVLKYRPEDILIIVPHCLQYHNCNLKVTNSIDNCIACGKCPMKEIKNISDEYGIKALVATGGTAARNAVKKFRPKLIISVACERDLASGIADVGTIPVLGILNQRPNGPCFDTLVDTVEFRKTIEIMIEK